MSVIRIPMGKRAKLKQTRRVLKKKAETKAEESSSYYLLTYGCENGGAKAFEYSIGGDLLERTIGPAYQAAHHFLSYVSAIYGQHYTGTGKIPVVCDGVELYLEFSVFKVDTLENLFMSLSIRGIRFDQHAQDDFRVVLLSIQDGGMTVYAKPSLLNTMPVLP